MKTRDDTVWIYRIFIWFGPNIILLKVKQRFEAKCEKLSSGLTRSFLFSLETLIKMLRDSKHGLTYQ